MVDIHYVQVKMVVETDRMPSEAIEKAARAALATGGICTGRLEILAFEPVKGRVRVTFQTRTIMTSRFALVYESDGVAVHIKKMDVLASIPLEAVL